MQQRLDAVAEETLLTLLDGDESAEGIDQDARRTLRLTTSKQDGHAVLEFVAAASDENLEDRLSVLATQAVGLPLERDISLRMLQHHASEVFHQQYNDLDIVTVHIKSPQRPVRDLLTTKGSRKTNALSPVRGEPVPSAGALLVRASALSTSPSGCLSSNN